MKREDLKLCDTYEVPRVEDLRTRVESGFGNSIGLGELETEEGELYY